MNNRDKLRREGIQTRHVDQAARDAKCGGKKTKLTAGRGEPVTLARLMWAYLKRQESKMGSDVKACLPRASTIVDGGISRF